MPDLAQALPVAPLHWTSIAHYIILLGALTMMMISGDETPMVFIITLLVWALLTAASLYIDRLPLPDLFTFLTRVLILGIPLMLTGLGPNEQTRQIAIFMAIVAVPLLVTTLLGCWFGFLMDPRLAIWC